MREIFEREGRRDYWAQQTEDSRAAEGGKASVPRAGLRAAGEKKGKKDDRLRKARGYELLMFEGKVSLFVLRRLLLPYYY
jgi:hypothetical protein